MFPKSWGRIIVWFSRLGFAGWLVFEFLNWVGVLHVPLSFTWLGLMFTVLFVWVAVELISRWLGHRTGSGLSAGIYVVAFAGISMDALGDVMLWYITFDWYDQIAHALAGGVGAGLVSFNVLWRFHQAGHVQLSPSLSAFFAWTIANLTGAFYEIEEYLEDVITGGNRLGDGPDTANDLMLNLIGSAVALFIASFILRRRRKPLPDQPTQP